MTQIPIAICIPSKDDIKANTSMNLAGLMVESAISGRYRFALLNQKGAMVGHQRNELVKRALELPVEYLLWIDSDMMFPLNALDRLIHHNKDIVGATYSRRVPPYDMLGHLKDNIQLNEGGCRLADFIPGGLMLVRRTVFEKLPAPWFYETYEWGEGFDGLVKMLEAHNGPLSDGLRSELYASKHLRPWIESRKSSPYFGNDVVSEDINFCRRAQVFGFEVWCDLDLTYETIHLAEHGVRCDPETKELGIQNTARLTDYADAAEGGQWLKNLMPLILIRLISESQKLVVGRRLMKKLSNSSCQMVMGEAGCGDYWNVVMFLLNRSMPTPIELQPLGWAK